MKKITFQNAVVKNGNWKMTLQEGAENWSTCPRRN